MITKILFFSIILLSTPCSLSINSDSTKFVFPKKYGSKKWKPIVGLDAKRSYFNNQKVKINGLRFGAQYNGIHRFGIGFYALNKKINIKNIVIDEPSAKNPTDLKVSVHFTTIFYERVVFRSPKWELTIPLYMGNGKLKTEYLNIFGNYKSLDKKPFSVIGISFSTKYYVFSWLAPKVAIGYRYTFNTTPEVVEAFNKPFWAFGISINPIELYKTIVNRKEK